MAALPNVLTSQMNTFSKINVLTSDNNREITVNCLTPQKVKNISHRYPAWLLQKWPSFSVAVKHIL